MCAHKGLYKLTAVMNKIPLINALRNVARKLLVMLNAILRDLNADGIAVVDTATHKILKVLKAGSDPEQFTMDGDGKRLFVANEDTASVSVIDVRSGALISRIPVGREPEGIVMAPDGRWVLVTNESDSTVSFIDTSTLEVTKTVPVVTATVLQWTGASPVMDIMARARRWEAIEQELELGSRR
jgi:YVTN family beta-propeller protein